MAATGLLHILAACRLQVLYKQTWPSTYYIFKLHVRYSYYISKHGPVPVITICSHKASQVTVPFSADNSGLS